MIQEQVVRRPFQPNNGIRWGLALCFVLTLLGGCSGSPQKPEQPNAIPVPQAFSQDLARAFNQAKLAYLSGDYLFARELLLPLAKSDHAEAQYVLGYMMFYGQGGEVDLEQAHAWFRVSAEQGNDKAFQAIARINQAREKLVGSEAYTPPE